MFCSEGSRIRAPEGEDPWNKRLKVESTVSLIKRQYTIFLQKSYFVSTLPKSLALQMWPAGNRNCTIYEYFPEHLGWNMLFDENKEVPAESWLCSKNPVILQLFQTRVSFQGSKRWKQAKITHRFRRRLNSTGPPPRWLHVDAGHVGLCSFLIHHKPVHLCTWRWADDLFARGFSSQGWLTLNLPRFSL